MSGGGCLNPVMGSGTLGGGGGGGGGGECGVRGDGVSGGLGTKGG